ncbi:MAG: heme peroxidase, partial [Actinobacteria bacterium]|nr:heme peroxidase [Actinomycetota bacterium]
FGGLLGTTFNYVFENQLTNLQNGDRFYYLARTPGMNLRAQLEGNSFAELMMRNTDASTLKADPFATADCKFELGNLTGAGVPGNFITGPGSVNDDPASECNENRLLLRQPNGTIEYRARNSVDPSGINGQAVYNGRPGTFADRIVGGNDNDTFWGGAGNDIVDGGSGDDVVLGGEGDDIITDLAGADVPKGGPGNDAIDGGIGDDIIMGGDGKDFTNGGANLNEHFLGAGDDFAIAGQGTDAVFGDSGDDWAEGGDQPDLLIGDSSTLFFDDHNLPGHDILIGQGGDDDYDM